MTISKQKFKEIADELKISEMTYGVFVPCHEAIEEFNRGKDTFYTNYKSQLGDDKRKMFEVYATSIIFDQLPLYTKQLAINDRIRELNEEEDIKYHPELTKIDIDAMIDDHIDREKLLRVYSGEQGFLYIPEYLPVLKNCIDNFNPEQSLTSQQYKELQPYYNALLCEDDFEDLSIEDRYKVALLFKEKTQALNKEQYESYVVNQGIPTDRYKIWDREKIQIHENDFIKVEVDLPYSHKEAIYIHKQELNMVIRYGNNNIMHSTEKFFPNYDEAKEAAEKLIKEISKEFQNRSQSTSMGQKSSL